MERVHEYTWTALGVVAAGLFASAPAATAETGFAMAVGAEYTTGQYGGDEAIDEVYVPVTATVDGSRYAVSLTVPFLSVRAPELTTVDVDGQPVVGTGPKTTESGVGDVILAATVYDVLVSGDGNLALDLTGKVKFGTADAEQGLGTGEEDFTVQADVFRFFDGATLIGTVGYAVRGDPEGVELEDTLLASVGGSFVLGPDRTLGLFYDYRESAYPDSDAIGEVSLNFNAAVGTSGRLQAYVLAGLSDSSADWGVGVSYSHHW